MTISLFGRRDLFLWEQRLRGKVNYCMLMSLGVMKLTTQGNATQLLPRVRPRHRSRRAGRKTIGRNERQARSGETTRLTSSPKAVGGTGSGRAVITGARSPRL